MSDRIIKKTVKVQIEVDEDGKTLMACPHCQHEFKVPYDDLVNDTLRVICPNCKREFTQVDLPKKLAEKVAIEEAQKYIDEQIKKIFRS